MTRQKKELIKKITEIENVMMMEEEMGCGFTPVGWFEPLQKQIYKLQEQLAELRHYKSVEDMLYDYRVVDLENLPFN